MEKCKVCNLPYMTRNEIEGMLQGGWTSEDLEHWVALRFRLKISPAGILHHYEQCYLNPPPGRDLIEVAKPKPSMVLCCLFAREPVQQSVSPQDPQVPPETVLA